MEGKEGGKFSIHDGNVTGYFEKIVPNELIQ